MFGRKIITNWFCNLSVRYKKFYGSWTRPVAKRPLHSQCSCENKQRLEPCWTCDKMERTSQSKVTKLCLRLNYFQNCHLPSGNFYLHKAASNNTDRANIKRRIHYVSYIHNSVCINALVSMKKLSWSWCYAEQTLIWNQQIRFLF